MADRPDPSRLRQSLLKTEQERDQHLEQILAERGPLIRGSYVEQPGRCGKPTCKCARGEYHDTAALYSREEGSPVCSYVPLADRPRVEKLTGRYRAFRKARAQLAKLGKRVLELADALQQALTEPYPPPDRARKKRPSKRRRGSGREDTG